MEAREYKVDGIVQGVGFRWSARETALRLGVTGWVRNENDGSVSCCAQGESRAVAAFESWLRRGPPGARVTQFRSARVPVSDDLRDFTVLRDD